jgi:hypothetical protein
MTPDEKFKRAKDIAARKALETYGTELSKACEEAGIPVGSLAGGAHIHVALMFDGDTTLAVRAQWTFHDNPAIVNEIIAKAKKDGIG